MLVEDEAIELFNIEWIMFSKRDRLAQIRCQIQIVIQILCLYIRWHPITARHSLDFSDTACKRIVYHFVAILCDLAWILSFVLSHFGCYTVTIVSDALSRSGITLIYFIEGSTLR